MQLHLSHLLQGRWNWEGPGGPLAPPEFPTLDKVGLSQSARSDQGLIALAPPDFFTFRRP